MHSEIISERGITIGRSIILGRALSYAIICDAFENFHNWKKDKIADWHCLSMLQRV